MSGRFALRSVQNITIQRSKNKDVEETKLKAAAKKLVTTGNVGFDVAKDTILENERCNVKRRKVDAMAQTDISTLKEEKPIVAENLLSDEPSINYLRALATSLAKSLNKELEENFKLSKRYDELKERIEAAENDIDAINDFVGAAIEAEMGIVK